MPRWSRRATCPGTSSRSNRASPPFKTGSSTRAWGRSSGRAFDGEPSPAPPRGDRGPPSGAPSPSGGGSPALVPPRRMDRIPPGGRVPRRRPDALFLLSQLFDRDIPEEYLRLGAAVDLQADQPLLLQRLVLFRV